MSADVLAWLLDPAEPPVRARALVELAGRSEADPDVRAARAAIPERGSVARLLAGLDEIPRDADTLYRPKYGAPYHRLVAMAEMGLPASHPVGGALLDACLDAFVGPRGTDEIRDPEACVLGNVARSALLMGRGADPRVERALRRLVADQRPDGGWHCWPDRAPGGTLDAWEPLAAFAALPPERRPKQTVARGVEFFLAARLGAEDPYEAWRRIHFPRHYYYDVLLGLDVVTALGATRDDRLAPALRWLESKRDADGRWRLDAQHPDLSEGADYEPRHLAQMRPLQVEATGAPSRWATLLALGVLRRAGR